MKKFLLITATLILTSCAAFCADFSVFKLDNGQNVIIQEVKNNPIVTIDTWIKTGSINENDKNNGVSHFLEHLFFKGTTKHPTGEFDKILESKGAITNASTSKDFTHYYITIPSKFFDLALDMHADMLLNPLIPAKELEKERKVVLEEISKDEHLPNTICYENLVKMLYSKHPYKRKVIGEREIIENISRDEIMNYYNEFYSPANMVTIVVGDVNTQEALNKIKTAFSGKNTPAPSYKYPKDGALKEQAKKLKFEDVQSGYLLIGYRGTPINAKDSYALDVLATILGDGRSSVFYRKIKDEKQLAFSISAFNSGYKDDGIFYISADFIPEKYQALENEIFKVVKEIQRNGVTEEQLQLAKNIIERDTYYSRESVSNIANQIGYTFVTSGDTAYYDNYLKNIEKVTAQEVKDAANKYLQENKSAVSVVLPEKTENCERKISNVIPATATTKLITEINDTQKYLLPNYSTVLLTPNTVNDIIGINITVKGGLLTEGKRGVAKLTSATMQKGTKKYTAQELAQILESHGINISSSVGRDAFTIDILTTKNEYPLTLELLHEIVNNAKFDEFEIEKSRNNMLQSIKQSEDQPLSIAIETFKSKIYGNSTYNSSIYSLKSALPSITQQDIFNYYDNLFNPENIVISINGNVDKELTLEKFAQMFKLRNVQPFAYNEYTIPTVQNSETISKKVPKTSTAWIILGWQTSGLQNLKEVATLQVINSILGTGMDSRLFKNLRGEDGLAYQIGSGYSPNVLKGHFLTYIGTNPENIQTATDKMLAEINRIKTEFVSQTELQEAKDKILGQYILSQETNLEKATTLGWYEATDRGFNFKSEYEKLINLVTESDIIDVANRIFNNCYIKVTVD